MPLVNYSDSDDSEHQPLTDVKRLTSPPSLKRKRGETFDSDLPPLPDVFHDLYASTARVSTQDDPSLHGGRQRATPHIEGNWPTHVYIEWYPSLIESRNLADLLSKLDTEPSSKDSQIQSLLKSELGADLPLHISLSRSLMLLSDERRFFLDTFLQSLEKTSARPFDVHVVSLEWTPNFEATRWFLVLRLAKPSGNSLNMLLWASNQSATVLGKPTLYNVPEGSPCGAYATTKGTVLGHPVRGTNLSQDITIPDCSSTFHVSIAWSHQRPTSDVLARTTSVSAAGLGDLQIPVRSVKAKIGNVITALPLPASRHGSSGILGT